MASPMEMLGGLKSRLGLGGRKGANDYDDYDEYDEYDEYDDYDDYDDGYGHDNGYDSYQSDRYSRRGRNDRGADRADRGAGYDRERDRYSARDVVTTRGAGTSNFGSYANTQSTRSASFASPRTSAARTMVDSSLPASLTPEGYAAASAAASRKRAEGLDSLFSSTSGESQGSALPVIGAAASGASSHSAFNPNRQLVVLRPNDYGDVESVAGTLKSGDAVILSLKLTPESLMKRILDFSFGVSSALDAKVDCIGDKVFAITQGAGLTETELSNLRSQGVVE